MMHLGLDLAPLSARAVLAADDGAVVARAEAPPGSGVLARLVEDVLAGRARPTRAGLAAFDPTDSAVSGEVAALRAAYGGLEVSVVDTGAASVLAEAWCGAARDAETVACLVLDDRVAAGILLGGTLWRGAHGLAGSVAWMALNPVERLDYRRSGGLHAEVSGTRIVRKLAWRVEAGDRSSVLDRAGGTIDAVTAAHVFDGAREGDGVASSVVRDTAKYVGMAVANLVLVIDPDIVVVSGSITAARDLLLDPVRREAAHWLPPSLAGSLRIEMSTLHPDAAALGAARFASGA